MSLATWVRTLKRTFGLTTARKPIRRPRLGTESLEDRVVPTVTFGFTGSVVNFSMSAANDTLTINGTNANGLDMNWFGTGLANQTFTPITGFTITDTSGGSNNGQQVTITQTGAGRLTHTNASTITNVENIVFSNPSLPLAANGGLTITGAQRVSQTNAVTQISMDGDTLSITASASGNAIGTAANPLRLTNSGVNFLRTNTGGADGNQFLDFGFSGQVWNINGSTAGEVTAGVGTVTLTNGQMFGQGAGDFGNSTTFNLGTGGSLSVVNTETIGGLTGTGLVGAGSGGTHTLVVGGGGVSSTFNGVLQNVAPINLGAGVLALRKAGTGSFTVTNGGSTYTGGTTIREGFLTFTNANALGTTGPINLADGTAGTFPVLLDGVGTTFTRNITVNGPNAGLGSSNGLGAISTFSGTITLNSDLNLYSGSTVRTVFTGRITGSGGLVPQNNGGTGRTSVLDNPSATNDFTGGVSILADTVLQITQSSSAGQIPDGSTVNFSNAGSTLRLLTISDTVAALSSSAAGAGVVDTSGGGSTLTVGGNNSSGTFSGIIRNGVSGTLTLNKTGTGTQTLTGANTYTGITTISGGTLQIGNGGTTGTLGTGNVTNNGTLTFNRSVNTALPNAISGTGNLVQLGTGSLSLTANNTYSGTTTITSGQLDVGLGGTTGTLGTGAVINNAILTFFRSNAVTVANAISGTGNVVQFGPGTATLTGSNTYTGATQINSGVTLQVGSGGTTGTLGTGTVFNGGTLTFNRSDALSVSAAITTGISVVQAGTGTTSLTGANTYTGTTTISAGVLQIGNGGTAGTLGSGNVVNNANLTINRSNALTVGNVISGTGSLTQAGTGTTTLSGANTFTGGTSISGGTLSVDTINQAPGSNLGTSGTVTFLGGTLRYTGGGVNTNRVLTVASGSGALDVTNAATTVTLAGAITGVAANTLTKQGPGTLQFTGAADNESLMLNVQAGKAILAKTSSGAVHAVAGITAIATGATVELGGTGGDQIYNGDNRAGIGAVAMSGGTFDMLGLSEGIDTLTGTGTVLNGTAATTSTLTIGTATSPGDGTFGGVLSNGAGTLALTKIGAAGTLTLGGGNADTSPNTFTGTTSILAGGVRLNKAAGTNALAGNITIGDGTGTDTLRILNNNQIADTAVISFTSGGVGNSAKFNLNGFNETVAGIQTTVAGQSPVIQNTESSNPVGPNQPAVLTINNTANFTYDGIIRDTETGTGTIAIVKAGTGTLTLSGTTANTFTGPTTIANGTLNLNTSTFDAGLSSTIVVGDGTGALDSAVLNLNVNLEIPDAASMTIASDGRVNVAAGVTEDLTTLNVNGGFLNIAATGTFRIRTNGTVTGDGNAASLIGGTGSFDLLSGTITFNIANGAGVTDLPVSAPITGNGNLTKTGTGTLNLSATNTYTGTTTIAGGVLLLTGSLADGPANPDVILTGAGSILGGNGTIGGSVQVRTSASLRPGDPANNQTLNTGNLSFQPTPSELGVKISTAAGATTNDQVNVTGTVNLTGASLLVVPQFTTLAIGTTFTIVNNDGADLITGEFAGMPEGFTTTFAGSPQNYRISYVGGTGNDVTLTVANPPANPTASIASAPNVTTASNPNTYTFTITYSDDTAVNQGTIGTGDIQVTGPNSFNVTATFSSNTGGNPTTATYTFTAPGGTWDPADNGTYTLSMVANQVTDNLGNAVAAGTLGTFTANLGAADTAPPTTVLTANNVTNANQPNPYTFTVEYTDATAVNAATFNGNNVTVTAPNSATLAVAFVSATPAGNGSPRTATYSFVPQGGTWDQTDNGTYTIRTGTGAVADTVGNAVAAGATLGTFTASLDTTAPTASLTASNVTTANQPNPYTFTVTYNDATSVNAASFNGTNVAVTAPNSTVLTAAFVSATPAGNATQLVATYSMVPPGGTWDSGDNGTFTVRTGSSPVADTLGNVMASGSILGTFTANLTAVPTTTQLTTFTPTATGFTGTFSAAIDVTKLNLFDSQGGALGAADVTVVGNSTGPVRGSIVLDATGTQITFIATGGVLVPDTYTVTLRSSATGFQDASGNQLDGNADGTAGDNAVRNMTVAAPAAGTVVVGIPDFTRGYGQTVNVPNSVSTGIPLTLSNGAGITSVSLQLLYNPALLTITGATVGAGLPAGANVSLNTATPGVAAITFNSPTPLSGGALTFVNLQANVPNTAPYQSKEVLNLQNIVINGGAIPAQDDDGIHLAAYLGDANGNQTYASADTTLVQRAILGINTGFTASKNADPVLIADLNASNSITAADTTLLQRVILGIPVASVPALPNGVIPPGTGPDPRIFIPQNLTVTAGNSLNVPVNLLVTEPGGINGISGFDLAILYDATKFTVGTISLGTLVTAPNLTGAPFALSSDTSTAGVIKITASTSGGTVVYPLNTTGSLVNIVFNAVAGAAAGASAINLVPQSGTTPTDINDNDANTLTLSPAPTNANNDSVDGIVTITAATTPTVRIAIPQNLTVTAGNSVTVPVNLTVTEAAGINGISGFDLAILYDAAKFTVGTVSLGTLVTAPNLTGAPFSLSSDTTTAGVIKITASTSGGTVAYPLNTTGSLVTIAFNALAGAAAGTSAINLVPLSGTTPTDVNDNNATTLTLNPPPTAGTGDSVDGIVTITAATTPTVRIAIPQNLTVTAGNSVTVPVNLTVTEAAGINGISGFDLAILYDAAKFTVGTVSLGTLVTAPNLTGAPFSLSSDTTTAGVIKITASTSGGTVAYPLNTTGSLVTIAFNALAGATAGTSAINLVPQSGTTPTDVNDNNATTLTLNPPPTAGTGDSVDGIVTITAADTTAPTTTLTAANVTNANQPNPYTFTVQYSDATAVNAGTFGNSNVTVTLPNSTVAAANFVSATPSGNGSPLTATYAFAAPGGSWDAADNGTYTIRVGTAGVADTLGNAIPAGATLGTFTATLTVADTAAPTPTLTAANVTNANQPNPYTFTVQYTDATAVNAGTFGNSNVTVTLPNSTVAAANFVSATPSGNGSPLTATYAFAAPGGSWDAADNGTYTIRVGTAGVADTLGNAIPAGATLGTFTATLTVADTAAPTPTLTAANVTDANQPNPYTFTVLYTDATAVNATTFNGNNVTVTTPSSTALAVTFVSATPSGNGSPITVTYSIVPPGGSWNSADNGTYTIQIGSSGVADTLGNAIPAGGILGTFTATLTPPDTTAPVTTLTAANVTNASQPNPYTFSVVYSDATSVNAGTFGNNNVTVTLPNSTVAVANFVSAIPSGNGSPVTATYSFIPSGGSWDTADNGTYTIRVGTSGVADTLGNAIATGGTLGTFTATLVPATQLPAPLLVTGPGTGSGTLFTPSGGQYGSSTQVQLIPGFGGELHIALGDVNGDGTLDTVVGAGPGGDRVRVLSGNGGTVLADFSAFGGYGGGVFVAVGDLNGDGKADVAVTGDAVDAFSGPVANGLQVRVFNGASMTGGNPTLLANFNGLASLNGASGEGQNVRLGGRPAISDVNGDGRPDLLIAAGSGGGPRICIWNGNGFTSANGGQPTTNPIANLFVFESSQRGGAFITAGDVNADLRAEIIVGGGPGGGPRVRIVDGAKLLTLPNLEGVNLDDPVNLSNGLVLNNFFTGSSGASRGGVRLTARDVDGDGRADVVTASGTNEPSLLRVYNATALAAVFGTNVEPANPQVIDPFGTLLPGGVWVG